jgi:ketosteroid isomerase-like protein
MSEDYVNRVRRSVDALNRADIDALIDGAADDCLFLPARSAIFGGYRGEAGMRQFLADNDETFAVFQLRLDEVHDAGDQVVAIGSLRLRPRLGEADTEIPAAIVYTFEHGQVVRVEDLRERSAALSAVGIVA